MNERGYENRKWGEGKSNQKEIGRLLQFIKSGLALNAEVVIGQLDLCFTVLKKVTVVM